MFYYKIEAHFAEKESMIEERTEKRRSIAHTFEEKSEIFFIKKKQRCYVFAARIKSDKMTFGVISRESEDPKKLFSEYSKGSPFLFEKTESEEITLHNIFWLLESAENDGYIFDETETLKKFGIEALRETRRFEFGENLIEKSEKKALIEKAKSFLAEETLAAEIERIYLGKAKREAKGNPVQYMVLCDDRDIRKELCRTLLSALYENGRIKKQSYAFFNVDSVRWNPFYKAIFKSCEDGAALIRFDFPEDEDEQDIEESREAISKICELVQKNRHKVLSIICIPKSIPKVRQIFDEELGNLSVVELFRENVFPEKAKEYLISLAKENHIRADKKLYQKVLGQEKAYTGDELQEIFDEWYDRKLRYSVYPQYCSEGLKKDKKRKEKPKGYAYDELCKMVGLSEAKAVITKALNFYKAQKIYKEKGISMERPAMHMVFSGNPGTAKTTAARLFARIMKDNGLLAKGSFFEVGRSDLVGKYVGWTAKIVKEKFKEANGGVLFIDEAYSLVDDKNGLFGDEAINTIVQEMENNRENMIVIFAGYPDKMEEFLNKNPGLRSRIAFHVPFADYSTEELCEIADSISCSKGLSLSDGAKKKLEGIFANAKENPDFGNGRFARNLIENAEMEKAGRLLSQSYEQVTEDEICRIDEADIVPPKTVFENKTIKIGF